MFDPTSATTETSETSDDTTQQPHNWLSRPERNAVCALIHQYADAKDGWKRITEADVTECPLIKEFVGRLWTSKRFAEFADWMLDDVRHVKEHNISSILKEEKIYIGAIQARRARERDAAQMAKNNTKAPVGSTQQLLQRIAQLESNYTILKQENALIKSAFVTLCMAIGQPTPVEYDGVKQLEWPRRLPT